MLPPVVTGKKHVSGQDLLLTRHASARTADAHEYTRQPRKDVIVEEAGIPKYNAMVAGSGSLTSSS